MELEYQLGDAPPVDADPAQLQQVIMNLVINAGQAICEQKPGKITVGVGLRIVRDPGDVPEAPDLCAGKYVALDVEDNGRGMDEPRQERMFDPLFTTKVDGKGLGLATVRSIVRDHQGAIWVRIPVKWGTDSA